VRQVRRQLVEWLVAEITRSMTPPGLEFSLKGAVYREMKKKVHALPEGSKERQATEKEMAVIVVWFQAAPDAEVVSVRVVR